MSFGTHSQQEFNDALQAFVEGCKGVYGEHMARIAPNVPPDAFRLDWMQKRVRVVRGGSVHCFVDMTTGDVLKAAGWKAPAKHARGNIYDEHNGLAHIDPYGPAYLR